MERYLQICRAFQRVQADAKDLKKVLVPDCSLYRGFSKYHYLDAPDRTEIQAGIVVSTTSIVPIQYRVKNVTSIAPLAIVYAGHLLWPFVLDPYLLTFSVSSILSSIMTEC